jgi:hypothetical protein
MNADFQQEQTEKDNKSLFRLFPSCSILKPWGLFRKPGVRRDRKRHEEKVQQFSSFAQSDSASTAGRPVSEDGESEKHECRAKAAPGRSIGAEHAWRDMGGVHEGCSRGEP